MTCPKCHRPVNEGNSPNSAECHETDDDEGLCEAYAKLHALQDTHSTLLVALEYNRIERDNLKRLANGLANGIDDILNHGASWPHPVTGEQVQYQSNPQIAEDALNQYRAYLHEGLQVKTTEVNLF